MGHVQNKYNSWALCDCNTNKINIIPKPFSHRKARLLNAVGKMWVFYEAKLKQATTLGIMGNVGSSVLEVDTFCPDEKVWTSQSLLLQFPKKTFLF